MFSRTLLTKLNCLDFLLLKGQSQDKVCLCKILWLPLYDAVVCGNILQIRETGLTPRTPLFEKHSFQTAYFKILKAVGEP
jgi:hypothetical protein